MLTKIGVLLLEALLVTSSLAQCPLPGEVGEEYYYAIEINGVLCGYTHMTTTAMEQEGRKLTLLKHDVVIQASALGAKFDTRIALTYHLDPVPCRFTYHDSAIDQGQTHLTSKIVIEGDTARISSNLREGEELVSLPQDVMLENTLFFPHLRADFGISGREKKTYQVFEVREGKVQEVVYSRAGRETLTLAGKSFDALVFERMNQATALKVKYWIDLRSGLLLKSQAPGSRVSYLADSSIVNQIGTTNLDSTLFAKTNVSIADFRAISSMKVQAKVEPFGLRVTSESLNVPGQRFTGTVKDNLVEGVFEIAYPRYDGAQAPPFPPDFRGDLALQEYLKAEDFIQSADPVLIAKAREITEGSRDSWEAARRLSQWVAEKIGYAIPGGVTARKTYDTRAGECGSHSFLLAAFCRAVGIPSRVVWGCMYAPNFGGGFGQHGWNEVFMGQAGWIPLDTTAREVDFVDSGHLRIGVFSSPVSALNPIKMEVLAHRLSQADQAGPSAAEKYNPYLGKYKNPETGNVVEIRVQDGSLVVDIPGKVVLAFNDADEVGVWACKMTDRLFLTFEPDPAGSSGQMLFHELIRMQRTGPSAQPLDEVPEAFRPYTGKYLLPQAQAEFTVKFRDGSLCVEDPLAKKTIGLQPPDAQGRWVDEFNRNVIRFEMGNQAQAETLVLEKVTLFRHQ